MHKNIVYFAFDFGDTRALGDTNLVANTSLHRNQTPQQTF